MEIIRAYIAFRNNIVKKAKKESEYITLYYGLIIEPFNPRYFGSWLSVNYPSYEKDEDILHKNLVRNCRFSVSVSETDNPIFENSYEDD